MWKILLEKSGIVKFKWNNFLDLYFRRKLKLLEGEIKLLDLNKIEDSGIKNEFDLNY